MKRSRNQTVIHAIAALLLLSCASLPAMAQLAGRPTRPQVLLPEGELRKVILHNCVSCHGIDEYAFFTLSRDRWQELLRDKHANFHLAKMSSGDENLLLDYLAKNFGKDYKPFPRKYIPPELKTFYGDPQGQKVLDSTCTECHGLDRIRNTHGTIERWRVLLLEMRARGAKLPDNVSMETLAEWLSRVQSVNLFE